MHSHSKILHPSSNPSNTISTQNKHQVNAKYSNKPEARSEASVNHT